MTTKFRKWKFTNTIKYNHLFKKKDIWKNFFDLQRQTYNLIFIQSGSISEGLQKHLLLGLILILVHFWNFEKWKKHLDGKN